MPKINTIETNPKQSQLKTLKQPGQKNWPKILAPYFFSQQELPTLHMRLP